MASARGCLHGGSPAWFYGHFSVPVPRWHSSCGKWLGPNPPRIPSISPSDPLEWRCWVLGWAPDPCLAKFARLSLRTCNGAKLWVRS